MPLMFGSQSISARSLAFAFILLGTCDLWMTKAAAQQSPVTPSATASSVPSTASGSVEIGHSRVFVFVGKRGVGHEHAIVGKLQKGKLHLNPPSEKSENLGELVFDMTSFDADTDEARKYIGLTGTTDASTRKQVNQNMLGSKVLNVQQFPTAVFVAKKVETTSKLSKRGLPEVKIQGDFTLHGQTKSIEFVADREEVKGWIHLRGSFSILQSHFGIRPYTAALGAVGITDKLDIYGDLFIAP